MATTLTDPLIGHVVDGRYEVVRRIARGGMATVYLARDRRLDRDVALKVMHPHLAEGTSGAEFVARFRREARAAARLTHHGLVAVHDQGVDGETSYLTMEYVEGTNLRRRLADEGALPVAEALSVAEEVLDALTAAHQVGLVHRDIKPENVLLGPKGRVKVADFGLARAVTEVTSTTTGTILGTVAYLAPELVAHGQADTRTDVYAVGILLFEMLTGSQPFSGATPIQVAYQHVHSDVPAPSDREHWLPVEVDELVGALAAREPTDRPADAGAALELLRRTRDALDEATLARRAEVVATAPRPATTPDHADRLDHTGHSDPSLDRHDADVADPDATELLDLRDQASADGEDGEPLSRTISLKIGTGLDDSPAPADDQPAHRPHRRRLVAWVVGSLLVIGALAGLAWWYQNEGPGAYTTVPAGLVGSTQDVAERRLAAHGLAVGTETPVFSADVPAGSVVQTRPGEGSQVRKDGSVGLDISQGPELSTVPAELAGKPLADVVAALEAARFTPVHDETADRYDDVVPEGIVIAVGADAGASLPVGTEIPVIVSKGLQPVQVINVVGQMEADAKANLEAIGLRVDRAEDYSTDVPVGQVMAQSIPEGTQAFSTNHITITISLGPPLVDVPKIAYGAALPDAQKVLEEAGFKVEVVRASPFLHLNRVLSQKPEGGTQAPQGSTITLTIT